MEKSARAAKSVSASGMAREYLRRNVLALVALFFALSGGAAWATHPGGADTIDSGDIINSQVKSIDIGNGSVRSDDVANDTTANALTGADIATDSLTNADIGPDAVGSDEVDGTLTGSANIANGSISTTDLTDESISQNDLGPNSVRGGQLGDILDESIQEHDIGNMTRTLNIPITSFANCTGEEQIGFANDDAGPDYETTGGAASFGRGLYLKWDGAPLPSAGDTQAACTTITVPQDFAFESRILLKAIAGDTGWSGQTVVQRPSEPEDTTLTTMNGGANCDLGQTDGDVYVCILSIADTLQAGDAVTISIRRCCGDVDARLYGVDFRYVAKR